jgi:hypothetical protein
VGCDQLPESFHGKEGADGSSPSEGFTKGQQMAFFVASIVYVHLARGSLNLSPRSVPSFGLVTDSRLEQTALEAQSTSVVGRGLSDRHGPLAVALGFDRCLTRPGQRS